MRMVATMKKPSIQDDPPVRKTVTLPASMWRRVASYRFSNEISTEVEAVRRIVEAGLADKLKVADTTKRGAKK